MKKTLNVLFLLTIFSIPAYCQQRKSYDLAKELAEKQLLIYPGNTAGPIADGSKKGISCNSIIWLKDVDFGTGTIEVDLRGRDVFLQSFLGIAFHGVDTLNYENIYFRPFNFQYKPDTARRKWSVQYMSMPEHDYVKLRKEHPGVFENEIKPNPNPNDWLHARIVVTKDSTIVYVNDNVIPSLSVKNITKQDHGMIGLWGGAGPVMSDFANLVITKDN